MTYQGGIYGVPWYTDAGMLYYRRNLLEESGFSEPPGTWDELKEQAGTVQQGSGTQYGFVFQGADYEGGVVNALEYIWTSGGNVLENDEVVIDSPEARRGLEIERSMISDGVSPEAVSQYKEQEVGTLFLGGDAVFMRNVPRFFALASDPAESSIEPEQIGIAALPVAEEGLQSYSSLGGWNLFMNANTRDPDAAYEFIRFMSAPEQQKFRSIEGSVLPTRQELYEDEEILQGVRVAELGQEAIRNTRSRPVSPFYSDISLTPSCEVVAPQCWTWSRNSGRWHSQKVMIVVRAGWLKKRSEALQWVALLLTRYSRHRGTLLNEQTHPSVMRLWSARINFIAYCHTKRRIWASLSRKACPS